ncbi:MAG: septum site-determining protein MinD [Syntrophomonadaceae bacterium]|jgi:septum site-determining protein MinD|nr:septum site-determining protein MinD [Syntrophomonadaceae bacterium]
MKEPSNGGQVVVITSGKGGVGKTTTVTNVSMGLAQLGCKVVAMDLDIGLKKLDLIMGLENRVIYDIVQVLEGECTLRQALVKDRRFPNLFMLPAAQTRNKDDINEEQIKNLCAEMKKDFDFILIDCPAGIERGFRNSIAAADWAVVVTNPEVSAVRDADRIIGMLESSQFKDIKLVINRIRPEMVRGGDMLSIDDLLNHLCIDLIGIVPEDDGVVISTNTGEPIILNQRSMAGRAFYNIARRFNNEEVPFLDLNHTGSLWDRIREFFSKQVG